MVAIVTDSTADLAPEVARELAIHVVPLTVQINATAYQDGVDLSPQAFYTKLSGAQAIPTTSQPSVGLFQHVYEAIEAHDILSIHISGGLSGTVNSARAAAGQVSGKRIRVVDSRMVSLALGHLAQVAAREAKGGAPLEDLEALVDEAVMKAGFYAVLDTLKHAQHSGRIGFAQALVASMLQVKPIITLRNGVVQPVDRPRTMRKALDSLAELTLRDAPFAYLAIAHADNDALARELASRLVGAAPGPIEVVTTGAVLGTHCGPGAVATCYLRK